MEGIAELLDSGEYSDMKITCKQKVFKVHKAVVCTRSNFFRNAMKNGTFKESEIGNIDLSDDDPLAVEAVLRFVYQGSYSSLAENNDDALVLHVRVYNLAEMYDIKKLKTVAAAEFQKLAQNDFKLPALPTSIKEIYDNTPTDDKALRETVVRVVLTHYDTLLKPHGGDFECMRLTDLGEFAKDLLCAMFINSNLGKTGKDEGLGDFYCAEEHKTWRVDLSEVPEDFQKELACLRCYKPIMQIPGSFQAMNFEYNCTQCGGYVGCRTTNNDCLEWLFCPYCDYETAFTRLK